MKKDITLKDIAGYTTERTVWQLMLNLTDHCGKGNLQKVSPASITVDGAGFVVRECMGAEVGMTFAAPEVFRSNAAGETAAYPSATDVWTMGALAFYAITGMDVFEGKGGETQTKDTAISRISSAHATPELSTLISQCLRFLPEGRPSLTEIQQQAMKALSAPAIPRKRLTSQTGKSYARSLVKFWPEEMVSLLLLLLLPLCISAQTPQQFDKAMIPDELATMVMRCVDLRSPQNVPKVSRAMDRDMNWTMMDELAIDKKGECTTKDMVDMFGLNDMGFSILKRHSGVTNAGGRFRDGRDPRYKYSFIEITVKKKATVSYEITGREGKQLFAIVPYEKDAQFEASIPKGTSFMDSGICYIQLKHGIKKNDSFKLTLTNKSGKNMAFALINYNSRNHE